MLIYFVFRSVVATLTSSKIKYTSELKINANLFCTSLGCCYLCKCNRTIANIWHLNQHLRQ